MYIPELRVAGVKFSENGSGQSRWSSVRPAVSRMSAVGKVWDVTVRVSLRMAVSDPLGQPAQRLKSGASESHVQQHRCPHVSLGEPEFAGMTSEICTLEQVRLAAL